MPNDEYFRLTYPASFTTDLAGGILSPEDRREWLRNYDQLFDTPDDHILFAIGIGFA